MKTRWMLAVTLAASLAAGVPIFAQFLSPGVPTCPRDTWAQIEQRKAALEAVRQINTAAHRFRMERNAFPSWKALADSPPARLPGGLALKWGADEPVPDWRIHYVSDPDAYVFTLTGVQDSCGVTFVSDDSETILDGRDVRARYGVVPLGTR